MRIGNAVVLAALTLTLLCACGKESGRVPFTSEGAHEANVTLQPGEVAFWTDIDIEYEGDANLAYQVELVQNGARVGTVSCVPLGPLNVKTGWVETNIGSSHTRRGNGKMACSLPVAQGGPTTVKANLSFSLKPAKVTLKKADLVLKQ